MNKDEILKQFQDKFGKRLDSMEISYQNHGGGPWPSQTIPEFISKSLDEYAQEVRNEVLEEVVDLLDDSRYSSHHGMDQYIKEELKDGISQLRQKDIK